MFAVVAVSITPQALGRVTWPTIRYASFRNSSKFSTRNTYGSTGCALWLASTWLKTGVMFMVLSCVYVFAGKMTMLSQFSLRPWLPIDMTPVPVKASPTFLHPQTGNEFYVHCLGQEEVMDLLNCFIEIIATSSCSTTGYSPIVSTDTCLSVAHYVYLTICSLHSATSYEIASLFKCQSYQFCEILGQSTACVVV